MLSGVILSGEPCIKLCWTTLVSDRMTSLHCVRGTAYYWIFIPFRLICSPTYEVKSIWSNKRFNLATDMKTYKIHFNSIFLVSEIPQLYRPPRWQWHRLQWHSAYWDTFWVQERISLYWKSRLQWHSAYGDTFWPSQHCHCKRGGLSRVAWT